MEFFELLKIMHKEEIRYVLVGGVAINLHGIIRVQAGRQQDRSDILALRKVQKIEAEKDD